MKKIVVGFVTLCLAASALALDKAELDKRLQRLTGKFEAMQAKPDKRVPAEKLEKAQGIVLLDRTKAGFIFAFQGGSGVALVKDPKTRKWSPAAFLGATEASLGFQVGGQQSFLVILMMTTNATRMLTNPDIEFGGEARGTAGNSSTGAEGTIKAEPSILVYDDRQGLYGGAAIKGGSISNDQDANNLYYGQYATLEDILFKNKFKPSDATTKLVEKIQEASKPSK